MDTQSRRWPRCSRCAQATACEPGRRSSHLLGHDQDVAWVGRYWVYAVGKAMALEVAGVLTRPPPTVNVGPPAVRAGCDVEQMDGARALDRHRNDGNAIHVAEDGRGYRAAS